ncbi:MAG: hypothetical protein R3F62_05320 [Planctomycetota bacterium]
MRSSYFALVLAGALTASVVWAQDDDKKDTQFVLLNKYREAVRLEKWDEVSELYEELKAYPPDLTVQYLYAVAQYELGKLKPAETMLSTVLQEESKHVKALYLLAKVYAKQAQTEKNPIKKQQLDLKAKDTLIVAAGAGAYVYRDIQGPDGAQLFEKLAQDSKFVLEVMKASSGHTVSTSGMHNPFRSPLRKKSDDPEEETSGIEEIAGDEEFERRLEKLYNELVDLATDEQYQELERKLEQVGDLLQRYGPGASEKSREIRERFEQKFKELDVILKMVKLQEWVSEGNAELKTMVESIENEDYDVALASFAQIENIVTDMKKEEDPIFERNAEMLYLRGKQLAERAQRHKEIAEFKLEITGIVIASKAVSQGDANAYDSAIINDHIHRVGDEVFDEEKAIDPNPNLKLHEIGEDGTTVTFDYYGTKFVRAIKSRSDAEAAGGAVDGPE